MLTKKDILFHWRTSSLRVKISKRIKNGTYAVVQCKTKFWVSLCQTTALYNKSGSGIALPRSRKIQQKR